MGKVSCAAPDLTKGFDGVSRITNCRGVPLRHFLFSDTSTSSPVLVFLFARIEKENAQESRSDKERTSGKQFAPENRKAIPMSLSSKYVIAPGKPSMRVEIGLDQLRELHLANPQMKWPEELYKIVITANNEDVVRLSYECFATKELLRVLAPELFKEAD